MKQKKYNLFTRKTYDDYHIFLDREKILSLKESINDYYIVQPYEENRLDNIIYKIYGSVYPYKDVIVILNCLDEFKLKSGTKIYLVPKHIIDML